MSVAGERIIHGRPGYSEHRATAIPQENLELYETTMRVLSGRLMDAPIISPPLTTLLVDKAREGEALIEKLGQPETLQLFDDVVSAALRFREGLSMVPSYIKLPSMDMSTANYLTKKFIESCVDMLEEQQRRARLTSR